MREKSKKSGRHFLRALNLYGLSHLDPVILAAMKKEDIRAWFQAMPWKRGHSPLRWVPEYEDYFFDQWERGRFDDYWRQPELWAAGHYDAFNGIPVMLVDEAREID